MSIVKWFFPRECKCDVRLITFKDAPRGLGDGRCEVDERRFRVRQFSLILLDMFFRMSELLRQATHQVKRAEPTLPQLGCVNVAIGSSQGFKLLKEKQNVITTNRKTADSLFCSPQKAC
jgi:hypothetical protein